MSLTDREISALRPALERYSKRVERGLYIDVTPNGAMSWVFKYRVNGKQDKLVIGRYPDLTLKKAREKREKLAVQVANGISPADEKRKQKVQGVTNPTVEEFGDMYYKDQILPNCKSHQDIYRYLKKDLYPELGEKKLKDVDALDIQRIVYRKRDGGHPAAAIHLRGVIKRVYDYAIEKRLVAMNPASMVAPKYIGKAVRRSRKLPPKEIREYLQVIYRSNIRRQFKLALHILFLTLARKSMLLLATWDEIDFSIGEWTIPQEHMKGRKGEEHEHTVYLSKQVVAMFKELKALAGDSTFILPGRSGPKSPFAKNALNKALEGLTFNMEPFTIHDQRRTASTLLRENGFAKDVVEKSLSHEEGGVAGIYNRAEYSKERKKMLQWWADYVDSIVTESKVIVGNFGRR